MIRLEWLRDQSVLRLTPESPLQEADFEKLSDEIDPVIAAKGKLAGLMIYARSFPGWDSFGSLAAHVRFVSRHHRNVGRIAVVTDSSLAKIVPLVALFVAPEVKHFAANDEESAAAWLNL